MKTLCICVPSKARAELFYKKTFRILKHCRNPKWFVFVEPQDLEDYGQYVPKDRLVSIKHDGRGLAYSLNYIKRWCLPKYRYCFKLDDDTHHFYDPDHLRVSPDEEQAKMLQGIIPKVFKPAYELLGKQLGAIGFPSKLFYKDYRRYTHVNKMLEGLYIIRTAEWYVPRKCKGFNEESYASAYLYTRGFITLRTGLLACAHDCSVAPGGLQCFDRTKGHKKAAEQMMLEDPTITEMLPTRVSTYRTGVSFITIDTRAYNVKYAQRLPVKKGSFPNDIQKKLDTLAEMG